jgi:general secretion pathway protein K
MTISRRSQKGGALLAVMWMSAALAAIAFSVSTLVRGEIDRVSSDSEGLRAHYLASGSVERGIQWMLWGPDHYANPDGSPRFWEYNQPRLFMRYASGDAVVEMIPEAAKLNINLAGNAELARVISAVGGPEVPAVEIAAAIVEWRGGAMTLDPFYLSMGPTFRPRHASFQEIEELLSVRGVTPELFYGNYIADSDGRLYARGGLRDCLSVWGSLGPFDANSVSPSLMEAEGMTPAEAARVVEIRKNAPIRAMSDLNAAGVRSGRLTVGGNLIWTLRATARLRRPDGAPTDVVRTSAAVVKLLVPREQYFQMPIHVLRFYDDGWSEFSAAPPRVAVPPVPGRFP